MTIRVFVLLATSLLALLLSTVLVIPTVALVLAYTTLSLDIILKGVIAVGVVSILIGVLGND